jgi:hypothetical protein
MVIHLKLRTYETHPNRIYIHGGHPNSMWSYFVLSGICIRRSINISGKLHLVSGRGKLRTRRVT